MCLMAAQEHSEPFGEQKGRKKELSLIRQQKGKMVTGVY